MLFAKGQKEPAVLKHIAGRTEIPKRRNHERDVFRDSPEFGVERCRVLDVLDSVGAEGVIKLMELERKAVDVINDDEIRDIGVFDDIDIDAATIRSAAADVEIPDLSAITNDPAKNPVTDPVEDGEENEEGRREQEGGGEHVGGGIGVMKRTKKENSSPADPQGR